MNESDISLRSVHTSNLPSILEALNISLLVTTYQAGKLVMLRPENGVLNTHFRVLEKRTSLSMPHSPRWYDGKLWVLHSGTGGFGTIDPNTGAYEQNR